MVKAGRHLQDPAQLSRTNCLDRPLRPRQKRKFGAAADKAFCGLHRCCDLFRRHEVEAERLLGLQIFSAFQHFDVNLGVQVMRDGHVQDFNLIPIQ